MSAADTPRAKTRLEAITDLGALGAVVHFVGYLGCLALCLALIEAGLRDELMALIAGMERFARAWIGDGVADLLNKAGNEDGGFTILGFNAATLGSAYLVTKLLSPPRILLTLAVTPLVARRLRKEPVPVPADEQPPG